MLTHRHVAGTVNKNLKTIKVDDTDMLLSEVFKGFEDKEISITIKVYGNEKPKEDAPEIFFDFELSESETRDLIQVLDDRLMKAEQMMYVYERKNNTANADGCRRYVTFLTAYKEKIITASVMKQFGDVETYTERTTRMSSGVTKK
jgi:hypothetical protein